MHVSMRDSIRERYYVVLDICVAERAHVCVCGSGALSTGSSICFSSLSLINYPPSLSKINIYL